MVAEFLLWRVVGVGGEAGMASRTWLASMHGGFPLCGALRDALRDTLKRPGYSGIRNRSGERSALSFGLRICLELYPGKGFKKG